MAKAKIRYTGEGLQFVGHGESGPGVVMDADTEVGGHNTGARPMELLLIGIGGCSGMDIVSILRKKKEEITGLEINVDGIKAKEYPQKFTDIEIEFVVRGKNLKEEAVKRAVQLSMDKYCSVKATLEGSAKITFKYRIVED
jgi:putative redox protein